MPDPPEWREPKHRLPDGSVTRLLLIHSAEHKTFHDKKEKISLVCPDQLERAGAQEISPIKLRWLHVQNYDPKIEILEKLVADCPFITNGLKTAALRLIDREADDAKEQPDRDGRAEANEDASGPEDEQAIFVSADYLAQLGSGASLENKSPGRVANSLLSYLYGDDVATQKDTSLALRKLALSSRPEPLCVPRLLCLFLGSGLIITSSELDFEEIKGNLIEVNNTAPGEFRTIQVKRDLGEKQARPIVIELDCKYVDFHRHAVAIAAAGKPDPSRYDILWAPGGDHLGQEILTPAKWIQLLSSGTIEKDVFFLSRKYPSYNVPYERETGYDARDDYYDTVRRNESPRRAPLHRSYTGYRERETDYYSRPTRDRSVSGSVSSGTIESKSDQESASGQNDQGHAPDHFPENTRSETRSAPSESGGERSRSDSPHASRSEGPGGQQIPREVSAEILDIAMSPGSLVPVERDGRWVLIVQHDPQRLLTWPGDQVGMWNSSSVEVGGRWFYIGDSDTNLHEGARQARFQLQPDPTHTDEDGIRIIPLTTHIDEDNERRDFPPPPPPPSSRYYRETEGENDYFYGHPRRRTGWLDPRNTRSRNRSNGHQEVPPTSSGLSTFPFFTWRVKHGTEGRQPQLLSIQERDETVVRILGKIHESITSDKSSYTRLYTKTYRCAADDLFLRHPDVVVKTKADDSLEGHDGAKPANEPPTSPSRWHNRNNRQHASGSQTKAGRKHSGSGGPPGGLHIDQGGPQARIRRKGEQVEGAANAKDDQTGPSGSDNMATPIGTGESPSKSRTKPHDRNKSRSPRPVEKPVRGLVLKTQLLEVSQAIFRAFLPSQGASSYQDYYHPLCERIWGSLDEMFRQITWSTTPSRDNLQCVVRDFDRVMSVPADQPNDVSNTKKKRFADCEACRKNHVYNSPRDAVKHIHDVHFDCTAAEYQDRLHDDPCSVWIKEATVALYQNAAIIQEAQDLIEFLSSVSGMLNEIQWLVASTAKGVQDQTSRPQLPSSLVHAFDALLSYYIFTARHFSLINRSLGPTDKSRARTGELRVRLQRIKRRCREVSLDVTDLLANAKKDILLEGTQDQGEDALGIQAVGAEFLMAALVTTVQNRSINLPDKRGLQTTAQKSADIIEMYKKYNSQIHFEANRRPQRRVFIAIHELEEELRALARVLESQRRLLAWYTGKIEPRHSDLSYEMYREPYRFERKYIEKQLRRLSLRQREVARLQEKAAALKRHVGQMIAVLEEDHGKAIRVFTIVTLFFLPLSFVTSFMGMNTNDIRNMESNQPLFWAVAVPVTALVLAAAFLYGYKSDEVEDVLRPWLQPRVRQNETALTPLPRRQATWVSVESKDFIHERDEGKRKTGRLGKYLLRSRTRKETWSRKEGDV
ncbi:hypothetical protein FJTKL_15138 [Diaporthe vaccinii]|uniref:Mg2+ transporter n=1 Tax=Diaporthe vaccinii TaxID=105482 RepID=A0ABR4E627_9PEZI